MRATLEAVLRPAQAGGHAVAGLVCLGFEDARAYARAAEAEGLPVILQAGPGARANMPIGVWGAMLTRLADDVSVPVVIHLDHGASEEECREAIEHGFTSVMFDGSRLSLDENIARTTGIVAMAHAAGVSCEGEIGFVGYAEGEGSAATDPGEAARFGRETGVDAMAVSVGNVHLQSAGTGGIDRDALAAIEAVTDVPLVIHGGSGVPADERRALSRRGVAKFNIGTELRQAFGASVRRHLADDAALFDRIAILTRAEADLVPLARKIIARIGPDRR